MPGIPVHGLLGHNGDDGGRQRDHAGDSQGLVAARQNVLQPRLADPQAGGQQNHAQQQGGDALKPLMPVGVFAVRRLFGQADAQEGDEGGKDIGEGVDRVGHHRPGAARDPREQLERRQGYIAPDPHQGNPLYDGVFVHFRFCWDVSGLFFLVGCHKIILLFRPGGQP